MTADVDFLNAQEGYRGTSYESVFLLSASEAGLRKVKMCIRDRDIPDNKSIRPLEDDEVDRSEVEVQ